MAGLSGLFNIGVIQVNANEAKHEARLRGWRERVQERRSSGQSVKEWCAGHGVSTATYYRWEREVLGETKRASATAKGNQGSVEEARFVELPCAARNRKPEHGEKRIVAEVETAKGTIRFYEGADTEVIRVLCEVASC